MDCEHGPGEMGGSFLQLRRIAESFRCERSPAQENELIAIACSLGAAAIPTCLKELECEHEQRWRWAYRLLCELGRTGVREKVGTTLGAVVARGRMTDDSKVRVIAILAELDLPLPNEAMLVDPTGARQASVAELASCIHSREDLARAADHLVETLTLDELICFAEDLVEAAPVVAVAVLEEILIRDDIDGELRRHLRFLRGALPGSKGRRPAARGPRAILGRHKDGRRVVMAWGPSTRAEAEGRLRYRALCVLVGADAVLVDAHYRDGLNSQTVEKEFLAPLRRQGFVFRRVAVATARQRLAVAARNRATVGRRQPRSFFVGRDLFGMVDEHLPKGRRLDRKLDLAALLSRSLDFLADGEHSEARRHLEVYVKDVPGDTEGRLSLGVCLMELGEAEQALAHLEFAVSREPTNPLFLWNLATAAHRAGRAGDCCDALRRYLEVGDLEDATSERERVARDFIQEHQRLASFVQHA